MKSHRLISSLIGTTLVLGTVSALGADVSSVLGRGAPVAHRAHVMATALPAINGQKAWVEKAQGRAHFVLNTRSDSTPSAIPLERNPRVNMVLGRAGLQA